jgi:hypothetical protein
MPHRLYVFVRTDLPSMTPGKAMAHSGHAASQAAQRLQNTKNYKAWEGELGFGTQINLYAPWSEVITLLEQLPDSTPRGVVIDPSYPYEASIELRHLLPDNPPSIDKGNGLAVYFRVEATAAWIFVSEDHLDVVEKIKKFPLAT